MSEKLEIPAMSDGPETPIHGVCDERFAAVRQAFTDNFVRHGDIGAAVSVYHQGRQVVDLWGGFRASSGDAPWERDSTVVVMSATKGASALVLHWLAERGELRLDAPVATYWPEFGASGKSHIPLSWVMSHQAGVPFVDGPTTLSDLLEGGPVAEAIALQEPVWTPGTGHGYHALTIGYIYDQVVRRVTGRSLGAVFAEAIADPLGLDFWIGVPDSQAQRVVPVVRRPPSPSSADSGSPAPGTLAAALADEQSLTRRVLGMSALLDFNDPEVRAAEIPAANGICTARSLAKMYAASIGEVDGTRLLEPTSTARLVTTQASGLDKVLLRQNRYGYGFHLSSPSLKLPNNNAFGHTGSGGSFGYADPDSQIAFGFVVNHLINFPGDDPRFNGLMTAVSGSVKP